MTRYEEDLKDRAKASADVWMNPEKWSPPSRAYRAVAAEAAEKEKTSFRWDLVAAGLSGALVFAIGLRLVERR